MRRQFLVFRQPEYWVSLVLNERAVPGGHPPSAYIYHTPVWEETPETLRIFLETEICWFSCRGTAALISAQKGQSEMRKQRRSMPEGLTNMARIAMPLILMSMVAAHNFYFGHIRTLSNEKIVARQPFLKYKKYFLWLPSDCAYFRQRPNFDI